MARSRDHATAIDRAPALGAPGALLLLAIYVSQGSAVVLALALFKKADTPLGAFLARPTGAYLALACAGLLASFAVAGWTCRRISSRRLAFIALMNATSVLIALGVGELVVRSVASPGREGLPAVYGTTLLPRRWGDVVERNRAILARAGEEGAWISSFLVRDDLLGYTVGADRANLARSAFSSVEGIRSPRPGVRYAGTRPGRRVALVGDSKTFGLDVSYEESWGGGLQERLGSEVQVLNFGVDGYGIDQAFLRYRRDVRPWKPDLVLFGVIDNDFRRSESVYTFLSSPENQFPFARPRFVVEDGELVLRNVPVPDPAALLEVESVDALPFIELDALYVPWEWAWRPYHASYLLRFVISRFPRYRPPESAQRVAERLDLNERILRRFMAMARSDGSTPILVFLPGAANLADLERRDAHETASARADRLSREAVRTAIETADAAFMDLGPCLHEVAPQRRFLADGVHYSVQANAAIAECLAPLVRMRLSAADGAGRPGVSAESAH